MSKKLVIEILSDLVHQQASAIAGGIVGGKENEKFAQEDLEKYSKALKWARKNIK